MTNAIFKQMSVNTLQFNETASENDIQQFIESQGYTDCDVKFGNSYSSSPNPSRVALIAYWSGEHRFILTMQFTDWLVAYDQSIAKDVGIFLFQDKVYQKFVLHDC